MAAADILWFFPIRSTRDFAYCTSRDSFPTELQELETPSDSRLPTERLQTSPGPVSFHLNQRISYLHKLCSVSFINHGRSINVLCVRVRRSCTNVSAPEPIFLRSRIIRAKNYLIIKSMGERVSQHTMRVSIYARQTDLQTRSSVFIL